MSLRCTDNENHRDHSRLVGCKSVIRTTTGYTQFVTRRVLATSVGRHRGQLNLTPCAIRNALVFGTELSVSF